MAGGKYYSRRCKRVWPMESLPDEVLFNILVRLPADYLYYKARLVCRRWSHIIRSYTKNDRSTYGLLIDNVWRKNHPILVTATQDGQLQRNDLAYTCRTLLFGSSNGLALDRDREDNRLYISNPAVNHELSLPLCCMPNQLYISCGIGYAAASMEYKVISPYKLLGYRLAILTVGVDKSWRDIVEVQHLPEDYKWLIHLYPVTTEGFIHWCTSCGPYVLTLDVETEIFMTSRFPHYQEGKTKFLSTGRFLSVLVSQSDQLSWKV